MKTLAVVRDVVVIFGVLTLCAVKGWELYQSTDPTDSEIQKVTTVLGAIGTLEREYTENVYRGTETTGIMQQMFLQNEILVQYQKLALLEQVGASDADVQAMLTRAGVTSANQVQGDAVTPPP